jgi:hypothetical protein
MKILDLYQHMVTEGKEIGPEQSLAHHMPTTVAFLALIPIMIFTDLLWPWPANLIPNSSRKIHAFLKIYQ